MKPLIFTLIVLLCSSCLLFNCEKDFSSTISTDTLVFGTFYGNCLDNCVQLYQLNGKQLLKDQNNSPIPKSISQELVVSGNSMGERKFHQASCLLEEFPEFFFNTEETVFGIPDAHDQGGIFIQLTRNGETYRWFLDRFTDRLPQHLQVYAQKILKVMDQISLTENQNSRNRIA